MTGFGQNGIVSEAELEAVIGTTAANLFGFDASG